LIISYSTKILLSVHIFSTNKQTAYSMCGLAYMSDPISDALFVGPACFIFLPSQSKQLVSVCMLIFIF